MHAPAKTATRPGFAAAVRMRRPAIVAAALLAMLAALAHCGLSTTGVELSPSLPAHAPADGATGVDAPLPDATSPGPRDAGADAPAEAGPDAGCPPSCTRCTLGVCEIECTTASCDDDDIVCPPGLPCAVTCSGSSACNAKQIVCAPGQRCRLTCTGKDACNSVKIAAADAGPVCIDCQGDMANRACVSMACTLPTSCSLDCGPGTSQQSCTSMENCGATCVDGCSF